MSTQFSLDFEAHRGSGPMIRIGHFQSRPTLVLGHKRLGKAEHFANQEEVFFCRADRWDAEPTGDGGAEPRSSGKDPGGFSASRDGLLILYGHHPPMPALPFGPCGSRRRTGAGYGNG